MTDKASTPRSRPITKAKTRTRHPDPQLYMPAMPPLGLLAAFENWVRTRVRRWKQRETDPT